MSAFGAAVGATSGVLATMAYKFMNRTRYLAKPWHYIYIVGAFTYYGYNHDTWRDQVIAQLEEGYARMGIQKNVRIPYSHMTFGDERSREEQLEDSRKFKLAKIRETQV